MLAGARWSPKRCVLMALEVGYDQIQENPPWLYNYLLPVRMGVIQHPIRQVVKVSE